MKLIIALIAILAAVLVTIWFRDGYVMGTAEDSLIFYNISRFLPESQFAWMEHPGLGRVTLNLVAARPTYEILAFLQKLGFPNFLIQSLTLWFILVSAGLGIYFLVKEFFPQLQNKYVLISVLFYWFNPLSLVNIWNRFLSDYIFSFGLLPVVTFLFVKGLRKRSYFWVFILILILPIYSFAFTYLAFDILLWIFLSILTLLFFLTQKEFGTKLFYIRYFFLTLILFFLTNVWWIGQLLGLNIYHNINSSVLNYDVSGNLSTLNTLSKKMGNLSDIFSLVNASFLNEKSLDWVKLFYSTPFIIIQYIFVGILFYTFTNNIKNRSVLILSSLFFVSVYLAKGTNPPFGELYGFIFSHVSILQVFRNPFEKASFVLSLTTSVLIGFGISSLSTQIPKKFTKLFYFLFLGFILLVWGYPFYTKLVFTTSDPPTNKVSIGYQVKVPSYYEEADQWLTMQGNNFRFIGFPLGDEGITYKWEKGYSGVELASAVFSTPGVLYNTAVPYYHELVPQIQKTLLSKSDFTNLANILNVRFIFTRHDIDFELRKMENPQVIDHNLEGREKELQIKKVAEFGQLTFWENLEWRDLMFYPANVIKFSTDPKPEELAAINPLSGEVLSDKKYDSFSTNSSQDKLKITYEKINPTKYIVHIQNANSPFLLVFSELFNDGWIISSDNSKSFDHSRVNYYANGWLIDKSGTFDLKVEFVLQRWLETGEKISLIVYLILLSLTIYCHIIPSSLLRGHNTCVTRTCTK